MTTLAPATNRLARTRKNAPLLVAVARSPRRVARFFFSRRAPVLPKLVALLAVVYAVVPIDLIPDVAPVIGWLDDAGLAGIALAYVMKKVSDFADAEAAGPATAEGPSPSTPPSS